MVALTAAILIVCGGPDATTLATGAPEAAAAAGEGEATAGDAEVVGDDAAGAATGDAAVAGDAAAAGEADVAAAGDAGAAGLTASVGFGAAVGAGAGAGAQAARRTEPISSMTTQRRNHGEDGPRRCPKARSGNTRRSPWWQGVGRQHIA